MGYLARSRGPKGSDGEGRRNTGGAGGLDRGASGAAPGGGSRRGGGDGGARAHHVARPGRADRDRAAGGRARGAETLIEEYLAGIVTAGDERLDEAVRYSLLSGGKRVRPRLCLATAGGAGADPRAALPVAAAIEMVHAFSLVHDDLPALDDDDERRGQPSAYRAFGEGSALLAGDALLVEAFRLVLSYPSSGAALELAEATLGMIGGQYLDITC